MASTPLKNGYFLMNLQTFVSVYFMILFKFHQVVIEIYQICMERNLTSDVSITCKISDRQIKLIFVYQRGGYHAPQGLFSGPKKQQKEKSHYLSPCTKIIRIGALERKSRRGGNHPLRQTYYKISLWSAKVKTLVCKRC